MSWEHLSKSDGRVRYEGLGEGEPPGRVSVSSHAINHAFTDSCQSLQLTQ